jgi:uncharacterized membrane protein (DUF106 family)
MFLVVLAALASSLIAEGISWLLIYRTASYKKLRATIEKLTKKLEKKKEAVAPGYQSKNSSKKIKTVENELQNASKELMLVKMKSDLLIFVGFMFAFISMLNSAFDGRPVAKLPFEPIPLLRGISHRNLPGNDFTESSMIFLYVLCSMAIRPNLQKLFGTTPPKVHISLSHFA